jgi:hypothetical protein
MSDIDLVGFHDEKESPPVLSSQEQRRKLTAVSARVGVWGIIAGLGSLLLAPLSPVLAINLMGAGFLAGGLGAMGTSVLVAKDLNRASLPLKLATFVGFPFGTSLAIFGATQLFQLPFLFPIVALTIPAGLFLGVTLMILLLTGFLSHAISNWESDWEE